MVVFLIISPIYKYENKKIENLYILNILLKYIYSLENVLQNVNDS
jgi:hypothetical protein